MEPIKIDGPEAHTIGRDQLREMYEKRMATGLSQEPELPGIQERSTHIATNTGPINSDTELKFLRQKMGALPTIQDGTSLDTVNENQVEKPNTRTPGLLAWFQERFGKLLPKRKRI